MYSVTLHDHKKKNVASKDGVTFSVDGSDYVIESFETDSRLLLVKNSRQQFKIRVHSFDKQKKLVQFRLNGVKYSLVVKDKFDRLLDELGFNSRGSASINQIKAPMPGLILEIAVGPGDKVKKGDKLLVLEAMKMENIIKSPGDGIVKEIKIGNGDSVEKNQVMIQF